MALFKINKGKSENLPENKHDGWAYFTTDDGKFYIDYTDEQGTLLRKALNATNADYATYAMRDEEGQRIVVRYIKKDHGAKQTISTTSGGTALRLNSSNSHGSLIEFSQFQTISNEDGSTSQEQVSLGYLGMWDGMPCYYATDESVNGLLTIILDETESGTVPKTNSDQLGGIDAANYVTKIKLKEVVSEQMNEVLLEGAW